jgi:hypothetical protein
MPEGGIETGAPGRRRGMLTASVAPGETEEDQIIVLGDARPPWRLAHTLVGDSEIDRLQTPRETDEQARDGPQTSSGRGFQL